MKWIAPIIMVAALLSACGKLDMAEQNKAKTHSPSALFADGKTDQSPPDGTVARGDLANEALLQNRPQLTTALLQRGQDRYQIFCAPCHGRDGYGTGTIVHRGFPQPPSYHIERLRAAPDAHFLDVIENGYGAMYSYAARVPLADRWAIVAYIRALQMSQNVNSTGLSAEMRQKLEDSR